MISRILLFYICLHSMISAFGQEAGSFKVLASKGANKIFIHGSQDLKPLVIGKILLQGDKIVIAENGYLGLAHHSGKTIEMKKPGIYDIKTLAAEVGEQNGGLGKKYIDFVVGEMASKEEDMAKNRHKYMAVTGSVERGNYGIELLVPETKNENFVLSQPILLSWKKSSRAKNYIVKLDNMFDENIAIIETPDTSMVIDLARFNPKNENSQLILRVSAKDHKEIYAQDYSLRVIGGEKGSKLIEKQNELKKDLKEITALNKIVLASFYEENKLYLNAMQNYEDAIRLQPEVDDYRALYGQFLLRSGIVPAVK